MNPIKAEFRKLVSIRSTYVIAALAGLVAVGIVSFYVYGYKDVALATRTPNALSFLLLATTAIIGLFCSFIAILSVGHEYRYSTILYTFTNTASRTKVFFTKWLMVLVVAYYIAALLLVLCGVAFYLGQGLAGAQPMAQTLPGWDFVWRALVAVTAFVSLAFMITAIVRNVVAAIALVLVIPTTIEPILTLLLKDNVQYLPYTAIGNLTAETTRVSSTTSLLVLGAYIAGLALVSYGLFLRRDAN